MTRLEYALQLAREGFHLFPIVLGLKIPPHSMTFKTKATRDPETLRSWFANDQYDIGIYATKFGDDGALLIVDVDKKSGKDGDQALFDLLDEGFALPTTRTHATPSGGRHLIFRTSNAVKQGVNVLGAGLDIRSGGGYVVAYLGDGAPMADAPTWLIERCGKPKEQDIVSSPEPTQTSAQALQRAVEYLKITPMATAGNRNDAGYKVACKLRDFGVDRVTCLSTMDERWRCEPPLDGDELRHVVNSAFHYGQNKPGAADPVNQFGAAVAALPAAIVERFARQYPTAMKYDPNKHRWLIDEVLPLPGLAVLYAAPGRKKSFTAIDMGMAVARGVDWHGKRVEAGAVIYVDADGSIADRVDAYCRHHALDREHLPFAVISETPNLWGSEVDVLALIEAAQKVARETKQDFLRLIVIDTVARVLGSGDENSGQAMGALIHNVGRLQRETSATVLLIHHVGKDASKGARGHSSLIAAVDTALEIDKDVIKVFKQRNGQDGDRFGFTTVSVDLGENKHKRMVRSLVLKPVPVTTAKKDFELSPGATFALEAFENLTLSNPKARLDDWREEFDRRYDRKSEKKEDTLARAFERARKDLASQIQSDKAYAWKLES